MSVIQKNLNFTLQWFRSYVLEPRCFVLIIFDTLLSLSLFAFFCLFQCCFGNIDSWASFRRFCWSTSTQSVFIIDRTTFGCWRNSRLKTVAWLWPHYAHYRSFKRIHTLKSNLHDFQEGGNSKTHNGVRYTDPACTFFLCFLLINHYYQNKFKFRWGV
jgi:hypothetical protein